jgi:hypothetical protein
METSASFEARSAPSSYPTISPVDGAAHGYPITSDLRQEPDAGKPSGSARGGGEQSSFSNRDAKGKHKVIGQS